ncbi:MAG: hypothetical protein M1823_003550 [Watsoniomyces obsoletus]|nr:MAG: hypothetical protein M1823_003550 [Watsoniomyces obsoletus]
MFWRFGGYANISTIDSLLDKPDTTLEELLDDSDLLQELKQHNAKLIEYLREENVLHRLLQYIVAPNESRESDADTNEDGSTSLGDQSSNAETTGAHDKGKARADGSLADEERQHQDKVRQKYAGIACEILSSETRTITDTLMENQEYLREFWRFLERGPPLDPLDASFFTKVVETLLDKKTEEMLAFIKTMDDAVWHMLQHVDCPVIMDLLLKMVSLENAEGGQGIVDWLHSRNLIPILLSYLSPEHPPSTQAAAGDFLKAIITISANASQNEQSCIGPNALTRQLVSETCISKLIHDMLGGGCALTVGVGVIIEVIRKNNSDYDPDMGPGFNTLPSSRDPIYLGTLLRMFAQSIPDFMSLILHPDRTDPDDKTVPPRRRQLPVASGEVIEPLGFDRFKTCELMAELLHCSNMALLNEPGSEAYVKQRDQERERLKAEGILPRDREEQPRPAIPGELAEDSANDTQETSQQAVVDDEEAESHEESRRLEVANAGDEDGFEDILISDDFEDEAREGTANEADIRTPTSQSTLGIKAREDAAEQIAHSSVSTEVGTPDLSPEQGQVTARMAELHLEDDGDQGSPSSSKSDSSDGQQHTPESDRIQTDEVQSTSSLLDETPLSPSQQPLPASPISPTAERQLEFGHLSPHSDDHPAPLFSRPADASRLPNENTTATSDAAVDNSNESIGTTFGDEGDSIQSALTSGNDLGLDSNVETIADTSPVVGDYLKMMFVEHRVVPTILDFFFRFPWNNFLHNVVYDIIQQVFNGPMDRGYNRILAIDLFETGRITEKVVEGQRRSDEAQARSNMRLGYMGHLTLIAEEVVKFTERHPPEFLSESVLKAVMANEWVEYVENTLTETRERDNAILGGVRPDVSVGARQAVMNSLNAGQQNFGNSGSAALASAGLTGGAPGLDTVDLIHSNGNNSGNYGFGSNNLLSGFGSGVEDDEDELNGEHTGEYSVPVKRDDAIDQASKAASGSDNIIPTSDPRSTIPKIPPPPPPLNIPPSRARRQLAQRLAAKLKAKQDEKNGESSRTGGADASVDDDDLPSSGFDDDFEEGGPSGAFEDQDQEQEQGDEGGEWGEGAWSKDTRPDASSSSSTSTSSSDEEDELTIAQHTRSTGPGGLGSTMASTQRRRQVLDADDDDEEEEEDEGEVINYRHADQESSSNDDDDEDGDSNDLVEVKTSRSNESGSEENMELEKS